jgi:predicted ABC-type ATPase
MGPVVQPVMTVFAGPNGSGKSTITRTILRSGHNLGTYINADDIASELYSQAQLDGRLVQRQEFEIPAFHEAERRRQACLIAGTGFCFETVFSHPSKVDFMRAAKAAGFKVVLYFVSTENSLVNVARVAKRVREGGHPVPTEKIIDRYRRSLGNLVPASLVADETALFDNSGLNMRVAAKLYNPQDGPRTFTLFEPLPAWVRVWAYEIADHLRNERRAAND